MHLAVSGKLQTIIATTTGRRLDNPEGSYCVLHFGEEEETMLETLLSPGMQEFLKMFGLIVVIALPLSYAAAVVMQRLDTGEWRWR